MTVGQNIRKLRKKLELTQYELATEIHIDGNYISALETGKRTASIGMYENIAEALGVPMWQLFCDLSGERLCFLSELDDCTEDEVRALRLLARSNKIALREMHNEHL
jgi:transcriptional regulator with XRE-family HTH domain